MRRSAVGVVLSFLVMAGCGDDEPANTGGSGGSGGEGAATQGGGGAGAGAGGAGGGGGSGPVCTPSDARPTDGTELAWDDGVPFSDVRQQDYSIDVGNNTYVLNEIDLHEAVRFELEHPARVLGFSIQWAGASGEVPLTAGLYGDFGYNGFDFWAPDPLWEGERCADSADADGWITYMFDQPVELDHPGLVYVAHRATPGEPVFAFDESFLGDGDCATFDDCRSALNMPDAESNTFYNGVSFPFPYDYLVRLHVEHTDDVAPEDKLFQPAAAPESNHVSFGDYDADGYDDMIVSGPTLYQNAGDGTFVDTTAASGIAAMGLSATGGVWGDYDNDGCLDLLLYAESMTAADALLRSNCDGTFTDVTAAAGITDMQSYEDCGDPINVRAPSAGAAWVDLDADGFLDFYLANFICWSENSFYTDTIWHNLGDGTFEEWTGTHGFLGSTSPSRGVNPVDYDADGDLDLFVHNYRLVANRFFENDGSGNVTEVAETVGVAGRQNGPYYGHTIGTAWGDLDGDGDFDLVSANLAHPRFFDFSDKTEVLLQTGAGSFADLAGAWDTPISGAGLRYQETHSVPGLADFDQDGHLDLVITAIYDGRPTDFYWGNGDGTFRLDAYHAGITTENGWGMSLSDFDNDGDVDIFATTPFENVIPDVDKGHWVQVRPIGNVSANWSAIGATVRVQTGATTRMRYVQGGTGKGGQDSQHLHFGLADATSIDSIQVVFPGGNTVDFAGPFPVDQRIWVFEDGTWQAGWSPPP